MDATERVEKRHADTSFAWYTRAMNGVAPWIAACRPGWAILAPCCVAVGSSYARFDAQPGPGLPAHLVVMLGAFAAAVGVNLIDHALARADDTPPTSHGGVGATEAAVGGGAALGLAAFCALGLVPLSGSAPSGYGAIAVLLCATRRAPFGGLEALGRGFGELASVVAFGPLAALAGFASQAGTGSWGAFLAGVPAGLVAAGALVASRAENPSAGAETPRGWEAALPLLAAAVLANAVRIGEYPPSASLALLPLAVAAVAAWRAAAQATANDVSRRGQLALACAIAALVALVAALRLAPAD